MDGNGETTIFYIQIWNHPTETSIYKWLFRVPGSSYVLVYIGPFTNLPSNCYAIYFDSKVKGTKGYLAAAPQIACSSTGVVVLTLKPPNPGFTYTVFRSGLVTSVALFPKMYRGQSCNLVYSSLFVRKMELKLSSWILITKQQPVAHL